MSDVLDDMNLLVKNEPITVEPLFIENDRVRRSIEESNKADIFDELKGKGGIIDQERKVEAKLRLEKRYTARQRARAILNLVIDPARSTMSFKDEVLAVIMRKAIGGDLKAAELLFRLTGDLNNANAAKPSTLQVHAEPILGIRIVADSKELQPASVEQEEVKAETEEVDIEGIEDISDIHNMQIIDGNTI